MGSRGRKSASDLATVTPPVTSEQRVRPPIDLTGDQVDEWWAIVNEYTADHFKAGQIPILAAYCGHIVSIRRVRQLIVSCESSEEFDVKEYDRLLKMQERESRCLASLAVRLDIAQTTFYDGKKPSQTKAPWQFEG